MQTAQDAGQGTRTLTMAQAIAEAIGQEMERDSRVFAMGEDIGKHGGIFSATTGLLTALAPNASWIHRFPKRPSWARPSARAAEGLRLIAELMFVDFFGVCFDQIYNHSGREHLHVRRPDVAAGGDNDRHR
ncbi:hypothetical protein ACTMU2_15955 [Cupriavidus basilensis]